MRSRSNYHNMYQDTLQQNSFHFWSPFSHREINAIYPTVIKFMPISMSSILKWDSFLAMGLQTKKDKADHILVDCQQNAECSTEKDIVKSLHFRIVTPFLQRVQSWRSTTKSSVTFIASLSYCPKRLGACLVPVNSKQEINLAYLRNWHSETNRLNGTQCFQAL